MITEQEQEILDNAPEGMDYNVTHPINGANLGYCVAADVGEGSYTYTSLADLRKKQVKTVWDAVNYYKGEIPKLYASDFVNQSNNYYVTFIDGVFDISEDEIDGVICRSFEFNQCVRKMERCAGEAEFNNYFRGAKTLEPIKPITKAIRVGNLGQWSDSELENELSTRNGEDVISEVKPRMKVEYVKAVESIFDLQDCFDLGLLYTRKDSEYIKIITEDSLMVCLHNGNVYHQVEAEITWQDELKYFLATPSEIGETFLKFDLFNDGGHLTEGEFIQMCHLVSSMNK